MEAWEAQVTARLLTDYQREERALEILEARKRPREREARPKMRRRLRWVYFVTAAIVLVAVGWRIWG